MRRYVRDPENELDPGERDDYFSRLTRGYFSHEELRFSEERLSFAATIA